MSLRELLLIASPAISEAREWSPEDMPLDSPRLKEVGGMLSLRNGFFAFESALHVYPRSAGPEHAMDVIHWNAPSVWRGLYDTLVDGIFFFAEDVFGGQFGVRGDEIVAFDPESGEIESEAGSIDEWAQKILVEYPNMTGYTLAHQWQKANGPIPMGKRLLPKIPFILGGGFEVQNLTAVDAIKGMRYRADLWRQLKDLPDGAQVRLLPLPTQ